MKLINNMEKIERNYKSFDVTTSSVAVSITQHRSECIPQPVPHPCLDLHHHSKVINREMSCASESLLVNMKEKKRITKKDQG